jgi:hypothetical protein
MGASGSPRRTASQSSVVRSSSQEGSHPVGVYTFPPRHTLNVGMRSVGGSPHELAIPEEPAVGASVAAFEEFFRAERDRLSRYRRAAGATDLRIPAPRRPRRAPISQESRRAVSVSATSSASGGAATWSRSTGPTTPIAPTGCPP